VLIQISSNFVGKKWTVPCVSYSTHLYCSYLHLLNEKASIYCLFLHLHFGSSDENDGRIH
jgi:hypothetical protein